MRRRSTLGSATSIGQAQGFSLAETSAPDSCLERSSCRAALSRGRKCSKGSGVVRNKSERTVRVHEQNEVRNELGGGRLSRLSEHRMGERARKRKGSKIAFSEAGGWQRSHCSNSGGCSKGVGQSEVLQRV